MTVKLSAVDDKSWISAKSHNGKLLFDGLLLKGESKTFQDDEQIDLILGNAGVIDTLRQRQEGRGRVRDRARSSGFVHEGRPRGRLSGHREAAPGGHRSGRRTALHGGGRPGQSSLEPMPERRTVALVTLGCARNEVDSEELAGRLAADGWELVEEAADADVAVVNTCGFVEAAKKDSVDALLEANDLKDHGRTQAVVAVGCMAERYGKELAEALPEADGVLGFDDYADISDRLQTILNGGIHASHTPRDRRKLLPLSPAERQGATGVALPGHGSEAVRRTLLQRPSFRPPRTCREGVAPASGPRAPLRRRLDNSPVASVKLASGCDRRCSFCAIPSFRGSFISRRPSDVLGETRWLAEQGVKEVMLVSENNTSYGKDLGDIRLLETLLPELAAVDGIERVRVSYLQPAEMRPGLIDVLTSTPGSRPYFDLSFQHSAPGVLRAMRRFGDTDRFLELLETIRGKAPQAGVRSNFIVGLPRRDARPTSPSWNASSPARGSTPSVCSATRTRTAPRRRRTRTSWTRTSSPSGWRICRGSPRS